jgi:hypothetical protein
MGNVPQSLPPKPISHCSELAKLKANKGIRQTKESLQPSVLARSCRARAERPRGNLCAESCYTFTWALLEALGIKLPVVNRHWPGVRG